MKTYTQSQIAEVLSLHKAWLTGSPAGQRAELRYADLSGTDLREAELRYADLSGTDLSGTDLSGADLREADLSEADLSEADLRGADLSGTDLSGADLSGTGVLRMQGSYEVTIYPDGRVAYGCETQLLSEWPTLAKGLAERHETGDPPARVAEILAICELAKVMAKETPNQGDTDEN